MDVPAIIGRIIIVRVSVNTPFSKIAIRYTPEGNCDSRSDWPALLFSATIVEAPPNVPMGITSYWTA